MSNFTKVDPLVHEVRGLLSNFQTFSWGWHGRLLDGSILVFLFYALWGIMSQWDGPFPSFSSSTELEEDLLLLHPTLHICDIS